MKKAIIAASVALLVAGPAAARDRIMIVGSSTVFPYTQAVAEEYSSATGNQAPVVESTGTGGGMKIFCRGVGEDHPDVTGASRKMKKSEWELCQQNGVTDVTEAMIGYDGLSIGVSRNGVQLDLTKEQLFLALAKELYKDGKWVPNWNKTWADIDASLPATAISVYGPPPTSGTRDAFVELVMHKGCKKLEGFKDLDKKGIKKHCSAMRQDGAFIEAGENDNLIVQKLDADTNSYGIFGYSFLYENLDKLQAVKVGGVEPSMETIADSSYGVSRPLFFYVKNAHRNVIPGLQDFLATYVSETAMANDGYLAERGLVVLDDAGVKALRDAVMNGGNPPYKAGS